jgi:hypothetical protein
MPCAGHRIEPRAKYHHPPPGPTGIQSGYLSPRRRDIDRENEKSDIITILFPKDTGSETLKGLQAELVDFDEIAEAGAATTRSVGAANLALWVGFAADAIGVAAVAAATLKKIIDRVRMKGVRGALIELPNGVRISIDSASMDEILSLVSAWKLEDAQWSRGGKPGN